MKKYIKWIMLMLVCIVIFGVNQTAICAKNNKVVEVKNDVKCEGTKEWSIISGIDKNGKTVWKYRTKKYEAAQLNATTCGTYKNTVIIFEKGKLRKLNKQTGKVLYKGKKEIIPAGGINFICDKKGSIYATGYFDSDVYKFSPKGKFYGKPILMRQKNSGRIS